MCVCVGCSDAHWPRDQSAAARGEAVRVSLLKWALGHWVRRRGRSGVVWWCRSHGGSCQTRRVEIGGACRYVDPGESV